MSRHQGEEAAPEAHGSPALPPLVLGALGVVFGDIGTSPLYAMRESFHQGHGVPVVPESVLGILSLVFWSLVVVICLKYLVFVMRADLHGEGGILALTTLIHRSRARTLPGLAVLTMMGLFGTALLYGDGMITPAISVLSAMEGLEYVAPGLEPLVVPLTLAILVVLFAAQKRGTGAVGRLFGPVMLAWFAVLALLGVINILQRPAVLQSLNPAWAWDFLATHGWLGVHVMGSVFLVVTGGEALYADMGHFGTRPIRVAWFSLVMPALVLNYLGQGALMLHDPAAVEHPFFEMAPPWGRLPLVALAAAATVIASQALISGAFSLSMQALQLEYLPRLHVQHTSPVHRGQIYMPAVNWLLLGACLALVLGFKTSNALAAAYGVAVTMTMLITTVLFYVLARHGWNWNPFLLVPLCLAFLALDLVFLGANLSKVAAGGWFPLAVGALVFTVMTTWHRGRALLRSRLAACRVPTEEVLGWVREGRFARVAGTAVYLAPRSDAAPAPLVSNVEHFRVVHERVLLVTVVTESHPFVRAPRGSHVRNLGEGFFEVRLHFGYLDDPDVPAALARLHREDLALDPDTTSYFLGRETVKAREGTGMATWRKQVFVFLSRLSWDAASYYHIPSDRAVDVGRHVAI